MNMDCEHLVSTPYGWACDLHRNFIRGGDMILCQGCPENKEKRNHEEADGHSFNGSNSALGLFIPACGTIIV